ncbi:MAG: DUF1631 domain-containing protein [Gammaproteobacteria bacterium]|nr:DUF1631 family protein [Gammaproteobacteria bacterium]NIN61369.1 DUF1631 family protein [Gammaproteobacteria bacterium]NIO61136.1 DUF1631 family protein [Gammaproteobacteria bacterium]NIP48930.1 DUF1631 domain-containing protein [Gammaproteobacteria bacterium]NIQ09384.1 DUF1631 domain-containing protein [Gammaproteobacteria bacterium]
MFSEHKYTPNQELLIECQRLITEDLSGPLNMLFDEAEDILFDLAEKGDTNAKNFYFNAMNEIRQKRQAIQADFSNGFIEQINEQLTSSRQGKFARFFSKSRSKPRAISIEESLALNSAVGKLNQSCGQALLSLDQKMSRILGNMATSRQLDNPFRPEAVCIAFQRACDEIESGLEVKLMILKLFEKYGPPGLKHAYTKLKNLLSEKEDITIDKQDRKSFDKTLMLAANSKIKLEIKRHLSVTSLPQFIQSFLYVYWFKLMLKIYLKTGTRSNSWKQSMLVIDDLIRLFDQKRLNHGEKRDKEIIYLIERLKNGMQIISVPARTREKFITELLEYNIFLAKKSGKRSQVPSSIKNTPVNSVRDSNLPFMDELFVDNKTLD